MLRVCMLCMYVMHVGYVLYTCYVCLYVCMLSMYVRMCVCSLCSDGCNAGVGYVCRYVMYA